METPQNTYALSKSNRIPACDMISYLSLFRLWFTCVAEGLNRGFASGFDYLYAFEQRTLQEAADIASGKVRAPALIPEFERVAEAPKIMLNRHSKRMYARDMPASRQYGWFRYASPHTLNGNQFFELLGRLSVNGRAVIYRLEYRRRLCQRRLVNAVTLLPIPSKIDGVSSGLSANHLWPD